LPEASAVGIGLPLTSLTVERPSEVALSPAFALAPPVVSVADVFCEPAVASPEGDLVPVLSGVGERPAASFD